jgi:2-polyprenyl-3-methyl-5-hydroxy-6-metoxy-1,4-benzoquinol methylase
MKTFSKTPGSGEQYRATPCAVCHADDARLHWDCGPYAFVRCRRCGHTYQNPQPSPDDLLDRYDEQYRDYEVENAENFLDLMLRGLADVGFFRRLSGQAEPSLLDIGCATGALLEYARNRGFSVQGVEVCEPAAVYGIEKRSVPIQIGTMDSVDLPRDHFSAVHFSHVIEHVPDPRAFLVKVREVMASDGYGVVVTPNTGGLQARLFGSQWRSAIADHVHLFRRRNLRRVLKETGFKVVATQTWGGLGTGTAPDWLKKPVDRLAKLFGFGDVILVLFSPA